MSQNRTTDFPGSSQPTGTTGNSQPTGTTETTPDSDRLTSVATRVGSRAGAAAGTATGLAQTAQEYGEKISEVATQAKDYMSDKVSVVGDKIKELQNADLGELAENAKDYARKNPGQALLISAAAGLLLGLIIRGRR